MLQAQTVPEKTTLGALEELLASAESDEMKGRLIIDAGITYLNTSVAALMGWDEVEPGVFRTRDGAFLQVKLMGEERVYPSFDPIRSKPDMDLVVDRATEMGLRVYIHPSAAEYPEPYLCGVVCVMESQGLGPVVVADLPVGEAVCVAFLSALDGGAT